MLDTRATATRTGSKFPEGEVMKWSLGMALGLSLIGGVQASGPRSWDAAEVTRLEEGWSREVGGFRLRLTSATRDAGGRLRFTMLIRATPAALRGMRDPVHLTLRIYGPGGPSTGMSAYTPVRNSAAWKGGQLKWSWTWVGAPATITHAHIEWGKNGPVAPKTRIRDHLAGK